MAGGKDIRRMGPGKHNPKSNKPLAGCFLVPFPIPGVANPVVLASPPEPRAVGWHCSDPPDLAWYRREPQLKAQWRCPAHGTPNQFVYFLVSVNMFNKLPQPCERARVGAQWRPPSPGAATTPHPETISLYRQAKSIFC